MLNFKEHSETIFETANAGLAAKAAKSGISIGTLRKVYNRGMAAWNSGHRPGTTPQQWAMARVNSYIGKGSGTYGGADKDLHEELDEAVAKDANSGLPKKYVAGLSASTAKARAAHFNKMDKKSDSDPSAYAPAPGDATAKTKPSKHTLKYHAMYGENMDEEILQAVWDGDIQVGITGLNENGLWANIHAKRKRIKNGSSERMRKPGSKGAPSQAALQSAKEEVEEVFNVLEEAAKAIDKGEYDYEGQMARTQLQTVLRNSKDLIDMLSDDDNMPEWVQSKITLAQDYISSVRDYMQSRDELEEQFDLIEEYVEDLSLKHGIHADSIWEELEEISDEELLEYAIDAKGHKSSTGGLTQKGVDAYNAKTGGNLQTAVTTPPSKLKPGSKAANRRKSFCARMGGVDGPMKKPNGEPSRKALALRKWNC